MLFKSLQSISNIQSTSSKSQFTNSTTSTTSGANKVALLDAHVVAVVDLLPLAFIAADVNAHI